MPPMTTTSPSSTRSAAVTAELERPWALPAEAVLHALDARQDGLAGTEAARRLQEHGPNVIPRGRTDTPLEIFWGQVNNPLLWVLIGSSALAVVFGKVLDGIVIAAAVVLNALIGFIQEYRANKAIEALGSMVPEYTTVIRDGTATSIPVSEVVPGDIVRLQSGDQVPADMRLIASRSLAIEEAALTGESVPVEKGAEPVEEDAQIGDRTCMAFGGTLVTYGSGLGVVIATGPGTELGRISQMLRTTSATETPLTRQMKSFAGYLTIAIIILSVALIIVGIIRGYMLGDAMVAGITLAVGAIPEGLPAIITIALAIGVQRMAKRRAVIRKLPAVETLGSTTVICTDKTGTLTRNEMTVTEVWASGAVTRLTGIGYEPKGELQQDGSRVEPDGPVLDLLRAALLCNDSTLEQREGAWRINGDPTEGALVVAAAKAGLDQSLRREWIRHDAIPFESDRKFMATLHEVPHEPGQVIYMKGAPEVVLRACSTAAAGELDPDAVHARVEELAAEGLRVLGFAGKGIESDRLDDDHLEGMTFLGLAGIIDPPREEAIASIRRCHEAGVVVKMITGDHATTAEAIGRQLGIVEEGQHPITGTRLAKMSDDELAEAVLQTNVFARVAPEHKLALVKALQKHGNVVAMTGDGVNDAPALRQANVGVAMGITGTAVSREAADLVLTDDNFATIAAAVEEGRRIYDNLVKAIAFVLPTNLGLALIMTVAVMFFPIVTLADGETMPILPISPIMMLWINLVASVTLAFPLAFEVPEPGIMQRPPRDPRRPFIGRFILVRTVYMSLVMAATGIVLALFDYIREGRFEMGASGSTAETQTMAVTGVILFQIIFLLYSRSLRGTILDVGITSNPTVFIGIGMMVLLQLVFIYFPPANALFGSAPIRPDDWLVLGVAFLAMVVLVSLDRLINRPPRAGA